MALARFFALTVFLTASVSLAQPGGGQPGTFAPPPPTPLVNVMLRYVGDDILTAELTLTPDQVKKLTDYRQKVWDETYTTKPSELGKNAEARAKATEAAFKETLTPAQYERARQLAARSLIVDGPRGKAASKEVTSLPSRTFATYPELVEIVKLSDEQKKQLSPQPMPKSGKTGTTVVTLTPEQATGLEKFLGRAPAQLLAATTDPRLGRSGPGGFVPPANFTLVRVKDVQTELKLTEDQIKSVTDLTTQWLTPGRSSRTASDLSPQERDKLHDELKVETDKFLTSGLKPEQVARLRQISLQRIQFNNTRVAFLRNAEVAKALGLNDQQMKQLEGVAADWETDMVKAFETDQNFEATNKAVAVVNTTRIDKANAVLTPEQTAKLKELVGAPYQGAYTLTPSGFGSFGDRGPGASDPGTVVPGGDRGPGTGAFGQPARTSDASFGKPILDLAMIARNPDVQAELKMTAEQVQKATTAYSNLPAASARGSGTESSTTGLDARATASEKAVADILTADQKKRLRQVMIQIYDAPTSSANLYMRLGSVAYPGVAEAIKLTPEQKTKIVNGTTAANVLTDEQKAAIKEMAGEPYKGRTTLLASSKSTFDPNQPDRTGFRPNPVIPARVRLINGTTLDDALKITPEQRKAIAAAYADYQAARTKALDDFRAGSDAMNKAVTAIGEKFEKDAGAVLSPEQRKRFEQLLVQSDAADSLSNLLRQQGMVQKLALTAEQSQKLTAVFTDDEKIAVLLTAQRLPLQKQNDLAAKVRDRSDNHLLAVLTEHQRATWKDMTGDPFVGFRKVPLGPRGGLGGGAGGAGSIAGPGANP